MVSSTAATVPDYLAELDPKRRADIEQVRDAVNAALPAGYVEMMSFGMIGWVVPLDDYPVTYNGQPLAYAALAAQKNGNSLYLNCVYASPERAERLERVQPSNPKLMVPVGTGGFGGSCADAAPLRALFLQRRGSSHLCTGYRERCFPISIGGREQCRRRDVGQRGPQACTGRAARA